MLGNNNFKLYVCNDISMSRFYETQLWGGFTFDRLNYIRKIIMGKKDNFISFAMSFFEAIKSLDCREVFCFPLDRSNWIKISYSSWTRIVPRWNLRDSIKRRYYYYYIREVRNLISVMLKSTIMKYQLEQNTNLRVTHVMVGSIEANWIYSTR